MNKCAKCCRMESDVPIGHKTGLCIDCLEDIHQNLIAMMEQLKNGGEDRKSALFALDELKATEMATQAGAELEDSLFSAWDVSVHSLPDQLGRIRRAKSVKIISYDDTTRTAIVAGSKGHTYTTTFDGCTCGDYISKHLPCKHMYRLAAVHGGVDFSKYL